jgi:uncharacterized membrane protein YdjX (TVP38/TMEM64 family)
MTRSDRDLSETLARTGRIWSQMAIVVVLVLLVPIVPFVIVQDRLEPGIEAWLRGTRAPSMIALAVVGLLAVDLLLPIPSSVISTFAGAQLGIVAATGASWLGMSLAAGIGFAIARWLGRPAAMRFSAERDLEHVEALAARWGPTTLVLTRALPVLAEASVLALGVMGLSWRRFWPPVLLANLGIALAYALFGAWAREQQAMSAALLASIALPVAATLLARRWWQARRR